MPRDIACRKLERVAGRHLWVVVQAFGYFVRRTFWISPARTIDGGELVVSGQGGFVLQDGDDAPPEHVLFENGWQRWGGEPIKQDGHAG